MLCGILAVKGLYRLFELMLGVIDTLRDLTELLLDPIHIPLKFNEVQDLPGFLLTGELRKLHRSGVKIWAKNSAGLV